MPVELSKLSTDDVDTIMEQLLLKKGLNEGDSLGNLKSKFDVSVIKYSIIMLLFYISFNCSLACYHTEWYK